MAKDQSVEFVLERNVYTVDDPYYIAQQNVFAEFNTDNTEHLDDDTFLQRLTEQERPLAALVIGLTPEHCRLIGLVYQGNGSISWNNAWLDAAGVSLD